jgi:APA family basic amino acid/polyamine antiporter
MARDGLFPSRLCRVHKTFQTPANAILAQGLWAITLTVAASVLIVVPPPESVHGWTGPLLAAWKVLNKTPLYDLLFTYVIFGANLFYMLAISSVFILRVRRPELSRPYRTLGYPLTPVLYVAGAIILLGSMLADHKSRLQSLAGLGIILLGLPAYLLFRRNYSAHR